MPEQITPIPFLNLAQTGDKGNRKFLSGLAVEGKLQMGFASSRQFPSVGSNAPLTNPSPMRIIFLFRERV